jgi:hypothetical protein
MLGQFVEEQIEQIIRGINAGWRDSTAFSPCFTMPSLFSVTAERASFLTSLRAIPSPSRSIGRNNGLRDPENRFVGSLVALENIKSAVNGPASFDKLTGSTTGFH